MVQVSYPGVYVQEVPSGSRTITGVATSIALFIGMAQRGPVNEPVQILNFSDYQRTFSADVSQGEMTDQVRQFFLNGGRRAYVVRIAQGATQSSLELGSSASLLLTSRGYGAEENSIRAAIDFNTDNAGVSFNLTLYRESFDSAGNVTLSDQELHRNLSFVQGHPRYVETVVNQSSALASAKVSDSLVAGTGESLSGVVSSNWGASIQAALNGRPDGRFNVTLSGGPTRTVILQSGTFTTEQRLEEIEDRLGELFDDISATISVETVALATGHVLSISVEGHDVILSSAAQNDIAARLGLGVLNGGEEQGAFRAVRPTPGGIFLSYDLGVLAAADRAAISAGQIVLTGPEAFTLPGASIEFATTEDGAGSLFQGAQSGPHLANVRDNLTAIVTAINRHQSRWRASLQGLQIALVPTFGSSATGVGASLAIPELVSGSTAGTAVAAAFQSAEQGSLAKMPEYLAAFEAVEQKVDLFNLLILPRSAGDTSATPVRADVWGAASSFCFEQRALLLMDAEENIRDMASAVAEVKRLRIGLKKDHAALYWPRVSINPDGTRRFIDPSGSIAGLMSRIDSTRGVWKAPAGVEAELLGTLGIQVAVSDAENGVLNPEAVNTLRLFPSGIVSWGARTMDGFDNSGNDDYKYVPVRRLALHIAESLQRGLQFAVFEPNDEPLWAQIRLAAGGFMNNLFRRGAFQGSTARESYFVKVDSETTTQNDINLGIVNVVVGFAPLKPAEFVVVTLKQQAGQIQV